MKMNFKCKMWVESNGQKVFGDGHCDILQRVERTGSLRMSALEIRMSYSQAWQLIDTLEKKLGFPLLIKRAGGALGGGSELTEEGAALVRKFILFRKDADQTLQCLFQKHFT